MEVINVNFRYLVKMVGGVDEFLKIFKGVDRGKYSIYGYTRMTNPTTPGVKLVKSVAEYFAIPMDDLYKKDLKKIGWQYKPEGLPKVEGNFIDGKQGFTYRTFQVIALLERKYFLGSLSAFVETLGTYKNSYGAIANIRQGRQRVTMELVEDIKRTYPEVNVNFIAVGEEPVFLDKPGKKKHTITPELRVEIEQMVNEKMVEYKKRGKTGKG